MFFCKMRSGNVQGKKRIFFCAEPTDMLAHFDALTEAFLLAWDCVLYYSDNPKQLDMDWETDISCMDCITILVSQRFLSNENEHLHKLCSFAQSRGIPFLVIMADAEAGEEFSRRFGSQCTLELQGILSDGEEQTALRNILSAFFVELAPEGSWIFLSHSSADIDKIRLIRNRFEENGQNPLAFHLKCLRTDTEEGCRELEGLIKREIDARDWFVFCESESANRSEYVAMERQYVVESGKKRIWTVDMSRPIDEILRIVDRICRQVQVYISYRKKERSFVSILQKDLYQNDFNVWYDEFLIPGEVFSDSCDKQIRNCDLFIAVLSENYLDSYGGRYELPTAIKERKQILLVVIGETPIPQYLMRYQWIRLPQLPLPGDFRRVTECIEAMALDSIHNNHY